MFMRYPEGKAKALTFSYDDAPRQDLRLVEIFDKYGMKATFNHNGGCGRDTSFTAEQIHEHFLSKGHEIALHGALHIANGATRPIVGIREVIENRMVLEDLCGRIIRGMAYPDTGICRFANASGYDEIKHYLTELDVAYARTLGGDNDGFELPTDFHAWMPTAHHDNPKIMEFIDKFLELDLSTKAYCSTRAPRLMYIWGHSFEFDSKNNWDRIEKICEKLANKPEIWYATNIEIYDYVKAYKSLHYSADGHMIYNPTLFKIWIDVDGKLYTIEPGETIRA